MKLGTHPPKHDGLTRWQRYRLKDLDKYRRQKATYARTPAQRRKRRDYMRIWRENNREHNNELARQSHHRNKHKHIDRNRNWDLLRQFGITLEQKQSLIKQQDGKCKICGRPFSSQRSTHIDHDHVTGQIRGVLCSLCNTKLDWYINYRLSIVTYLKQERLVISS